MKSLTKNSVFILCFLLINSNAMTQHFQPINNNNPYNPMSIIVSSTLLDATNLQSSDEIGVFDINASGNEICVGQISIINNFTSDTNYIITSSADDPTTPSLQDGFIDSHQIIFKIWDSSESLEVILTKAIFDNSLNTVYTSLGTALCDITASTFETWNGTQDTVWNNELNWDYEKIPSTGFNILIPASPTGGKFPSVSVQTAKCKNITIELNAVLKIHGKLSIGNNGMITD